MAQKPFVGRGWITAQTSVTLLLSAHDKVCFVWLAGLVWELFSVKAVISWWDWWLRRVIYCPRLYGAEINGQMEKGLKSQHPDSLLPKYHVRRSGLFHLLKQWNTAGISKPGLQGLFGLLKLHRHPLVACYMTTGYHMSSEECHQ